MELVFATIPIMAFVFVLALVPGVIATYWDAGDRRSAKRPSKLPTAPEKETKLAA